MYTESNKELSLYYTSISLIHFIVFSYLSIEIYLKVMQVSKLVNGRGKGYVFIIMSWSKIVSYEYVCM